MNGREQEYAELLIKNVKLSVIESRKDRQTEVRTYDPSTIWNKSHANGGGWVEWGGDKGTHVGLYGSVRLFVCLCPHVCMYACKFQLATIRGI